MLFFIAMNDEFYIKKTLSLAVRARGRTSPNPMVGALLVKNDRIISEGYHKKAGTPHAEVIAIDNAKGQAKGATLYVSLEPCCHKDKRTPPCTEKIIASGIKKVVISMPDPNPKVSGKGIEELERAGIKVISGILEEKARELNEYYIKYITKGMPFVTLKIAMTLDGKIATPDGESKWITGEKARKLVHKYRGSVDAVLTAIGTVKADNPQLTCRSGKGKNPVRILIDPDLEVPLYSNILTTPPETIIVTNRSKAGSEKSEKTREKIIENGIKLIAYNTEKLDLQWLMRELGKLGITSIMVEGGSSLNSYCLNNGIVDKILFFIAPKIIGGKDSITAVGGKSFRKLKDAFRVRDISIRQIGDDILIEGHIRD